MSKAYLVLSNGRIFEGVSIGAPGSVIGELVFTTGMEGYLETLTDPSYAGQIIMQTFPLIGNYGVIPEDFEGACAAKGYVVRDLCEAPSNFRAAGVLNDFLKEQGVVGIAGVDTREITRVIREHGVMNAAICTEIPTDFTAIHQYRVQNVVEAVSTNRPQVFPAYGREDYRVTLIDYGAKRNIIESLRKRGCSVTVVPHNTKAADILAAAPHGVMLSNGPGDPAENVQCIAEIRALIGKLPIFGICLGHQLTALAMGGKTVKLKYGHHGGNQPVEDLQSGRTYITSQNHGYAVVSESLNGGGILRFRNANDESCEGIDYPDLRCFTVQFHPEACAGPRDTAFLFDRFIELMGGARNA